MNKGLEALEKIYHTICMNNLERNIKWDIDKYDHCACVSVEDFVECYEVIEKELKTLEDIEEELGIDLIKFFMGFKKNVRIYYKKGKKIKEGIMTLGILQKYGKTWALTKEELEK